MKSTDAPSLIATPFAQNGTRNDIPASDPGFSGDDAGRAAFTTGFPDITMRPITAGGKPPFGADFNGILYALSNAARYYGAGGHYRFNGSFAAAIGGYPIGATVQASDGMGHWLNVVDANGTDPESALSTGWIPLSDHNGTATVSLTGNVALSASQAAKANIRLTGNIKGNLTVTFPAWTKRYSIINDCTGDQSVICTTGNGESISIKNGAKYEIGCDGKNLTVATVNASQVFAEPNKNISSLDAPTVQQIINALGKAASRGFFDTGFADQIPYGDYAAASTGCVAAVRDYAKSINDNLKQIAKTGDLNDGTGVLNMAHGGTGRNDGDLQAGTVYAHTIHHKNGTVALRTESGDVLTVENGNIASFKHSDGVESFRIDNGRISFGGGWNDPNLYKEGGDIVVRASSGDMLRVEKGNALTFKRADGSETMRVQNGLLTLSGGSRPTLMRFDYGTVLQAESGDQLSIEKGAALVVKNAKGDAEFKITGGNLYLTGEDRPVLSRLDHGTFLTAKSGDYMSIEPGNAITAHDSTGKMTLKFENGVMTVGTVPFEHVSGNVPFKRVDGLGDAAAKGFFDTGDVDKVPYGDYAAASTGCVAALRDFAKKLVEGLKNSLGAAAWKGVVDTGQPEDVGWGSEKLASAGCVSGLFYRMQEHQKVGTLAMMVYSGSQGKTIGEVVSASELRFSSADGNPADATTPQGKWRCLGYCKGGDYPGRSRTTLFVRIE